jgi:hypothetical protein
MASKTEGVLVTRASERRGRTAEELVDRHRRLPVVDGGLMLRENDEFFGVEDLAEGAWPRVAG